MPHANEIIALLAWVRILSPCSESRLCSHCPRRRRRDTGVRRRLWESRCGTRYFSVPSLGVSNLVRTNKKSTLRFKVRHLQKIQNSFDSETGFRLSCSCNQTGARLSLPGVFLCDRAGGTKEPVAWIRSTFPSIKPWTVSQSPATGQPGRGAL